LNDDEIAEKKSMISLLTDQIDLSYFNQADKEMEWMIYYDFKKDLDNDYYQLRESRVTKTLQAMYNSESNDISTLLDILAADISSSYPSLSYQQRDLITSDYFYSSVKKQIETLPEGQARTDAEIILLYVSLITSASNYNDSIHLSRQCSLNISGIMKTYIPVYSVETICNRLEQKNINVDKTKSLMISTTTKFLDIKTKGIK